MVRNYPIRHTKSTVPIVLTDASLVDAGGGEHTVADASKVAKTGDTMTGGLTLSDGANLTLSGANALGEGNIVMAAAASAAFDTNLVTSDSTAKTMGFICGATAAFAGAYGPFFGLRGNTYTAYANQRGTLFFGAGIPSAPNATLEGRIRFLTNDTDRFVIRYDGTALVYGILTLPKTSGYGIMVDPAAPTFGWRDLTCAIDPKATGGGSPSRALYRGTIYAYAFAAGDIADFDGFHIPHDYVPGSNLYVHVHWSHNGTAISGSAVFEVTMSYAKGHNQANFPAEVTQTITVATPNIATVPQYRHRVDEVQASTAGGSATLHNTTNLEVDGLMIGYIKLVTLPTITGGSLFVHTVDIHYQSSNMATKQRAPNFYV